MAEKDPDAPGAPRPVGAAESSGSIDVKLSDPELGAAPAAGAQPAVEDVPVAVRVERRKRARTVPQLAATVAEKVVHTGDAVIDTVVKAGELAGESFAHLPVASRVMPKTRRGRVMAKSVFVSFLLVFSWIAVIVGLQLRRARPPDFRPLAEKILIQIRDGHARDVYAAASTRFQEVVVEDTFVENMNDLNHTMGRYVEISAVLDTVVNRGPSGRTGRLDLRAEYAQGPSRGSLSFRWEDGKWKLLGISMEVPKSVHISERDRQRRVEGPKDELRSAADVILTHSARGEADVIWNQAALGFQQSISLENFRQTEADRRKVLGPYRRILDVTSARQNPGRTGASLQLLIEFEKATITGSFEFRRIDDQWKLTFYKLIMPLPRVPQ